MDIFVIFGKRWIRRYGKRVRNDLGSRQRQPQTSQGDCDALKEDNALILATDPDQEEAISWHLEGFAQTPRDQKRYACQPWYL